MSAQRGPARNGRGPDPTRPEPRWQAVNLRRASVPRSVGPLEAAVTLIPIRRLRGRKRRLGFCDLAHPHVLGFCDLAHSHVLPQLAACEHEAVSIEPLSKESREIVSRKRSTLPNNQMSLCAPLHFKLLRNLFSSSSGQARPLRLCV